MDSFILFKQLVGGVILLDHLSNTPFFYSYFSNRLLPHSLIRSKGIAVLIWLVWLVCSFGLLFNVFPLESSICLLALFRHFFINNAEKSGRGPQFLGFLLYFVSLYMVGFVLLDRFASGQSFWLLVLIFQIEIGLIIFSGGISKAYRGYLNNQGAEYALSNPSWGKLFFLFRRLSPHNVLFKILNWTAVIAEVAAGICLIFIPFNSVGIILFGLVFVFSLVMFRVNTISLLMLSMAIFLWKSGPQITFFNFNSASVIDWLLFCYLIHLIAVFSIKTCIYCFKWMPPHCVNRYTYFSDIIHPIKVWTVFLWFMVDFFVQVSLVNKEDSPTEIVLYNGFSNSFFNSYFSLYGLIRYLKCAESCTLMCLFAKLKVKSDNEDLLESNIIAYANTLCPAAKHDTHTVKFRFIMIEKVDSTFKNTPILDISVDLSHQKLTYLSPTILAMSIAVFLYSI